MKFKKGDKIKVFHPGMMGVIKEGTVHKIGSKYIYVDLGELLGGIVKCRPSDVVEA
jgi:hypothetical protein